ncbi:unnamed protein product [Rotaria magnacalcarata]|uniref:Uncharacterized protein n=1 Tax=Rotaria magnacalcarata TaxID=392030 RepID=A0A816PT75_9BILA|nr:unnamed protein product [Rotaria magnacalcarata]
MVCHVDSNLALNNFNKNFLDSYKQIRSYILTTIDPLIITKEDTLILYHRDHQTSIHISVQLYHHINSISHIAFTIYLKLFTIKLNNRNLSFKELKNLKSYLQEIHVNQRSLNISDFSSSNELFQVQLDIINLSTQFIRSLIRSKQLNMTKSKEYCLKATKLASINIRHGTRIQIDHLYSIFF